MIWLLVAVLVLLLAALVSPLRIELRASAGEALRYSLALRPFGRIGPRLSVADSDKPKKKKPKPKQEEKRKLTGKTWSRDPMRIVRGALRMISEVIGRIHIDKAAVDLRFGACDPAETGEIYGYLTPIIYGTYGRPHLQINVEPVFDRSVFDGHATLDLTLTPARLIPPFVRFGWSAFGPRQ